MVIEGIGNGNPVRPRESERTARPSRGETVPVRPDAVDATQPTERPDAARSVRHAGEDVELQSRPQTNPGAEAIRQKIARGEYDTGEVLESILSGLERDAPDLFG